MVPPPSNDNGSAEVQAMAMRLTDSLGPYVGKPPTMIVQALLRVAVAIGVECMPRRIMLETVETLYWEFCPKPPVVKAKRQS